LSFALLIGGGSRRFQAGFPLIGLFRFGQPPLTDSARKTQHAGQVTLTVSSMHAARDKARDAYQRIAAFLSGLRKNAEQLDPLRKWYRILSEAMRHFLKGRQLEPPIRLNPA